MEADFLIAEIRRFYKELNKFWREEICHVVEALKRRRVDPRDYERWKSFRSSLHQTIEYWKVCILPPHCYAFQTDRKLRDEEPTTQR